MEKRLNIKKWLLGTALLLISMLAGTSCVMDNDDLPDCPPPTPPSKDAPVVTAGLYCNEKLIAWEEGSAIGVYLIDNEKEALLQDSLGAPYILNDVEKGIFLPQWGISDQVIARPPLGAVYDALGIFPYGNALKDTKTASLSVADQSEPEKLDLFIPRRVHSITAETDTIHLDFYRRMSRLLFNLTMTEVGADNTETEANAKLAGASILVNGLPVNGTFALESDKVETDGIQPFQAYMAENGQQGQAIVFPGTSTKDVRFQVSLPQYPDTLYSFVFSEEMILESCRTHTLALDMKYVHKPVIKQYNIKYRYEGAANKDNVTVTRGNNLTAWGEGDIIVVDENSDFTFQYQSSLKVSVRTEDGEVLPMTPGKSYTFSEIQKDITIIIYVEEDPGPGPGPGPEPEITHKVTYRYEGEANANNVTVFKDGMSSNWAQTETITVKDKEDFTFGFRSDMIVSVKTKDGETLSMGSGNPYTFTKVEKDIEIIISAETPEYAVKYVFEGKYTKENVTVEKKDPAFMDWAVNSNVYITEGDNFTFKPTSDYTVTVTVNGKPLEKNSDGSYTIKDIYENKLIIISTNIHKVTYTFIGEANESNTTVTKQTGSQLVSWKKGETGRVFLDDGKNFTFQVASDYEATVNRDNTDTSKYSSESVDNRTNKHHLNEIKDDIEIVINVDTNINLTEHSVQYRFIRQANSTNTTVTQSGEGWEKESEGIKIVSHGGDFKFEAVSPAPYNYTMTVTYYYTNVSNAQKQTLIPVGNVYTISNITNNVMVEISVTTWKVSFTYVNDPFVNQDNIPLMQGGITWEENTEKEVEDGHDFTFKNNSGYTIRVENKDHDLSFTVSPNASHTINNVTKDIELTVTASICEVSYVLDTPTLPDWIDVKLESKSGATWTYADHKLIESGKDFTFYTASKSGVSGVKIEYVKVETEKITSLNNVYSKIITKNTVFHIKAVKTHLISYEIRGSERPANFDIFKDSNISWEKGDKGKVTINAGENFTFGYTGQDLDKYTITVIKGNVSITMDDNKYTEMNVQEDIHYVITSDKKPQVTVTTNGNLDNIIKPNIEGGYVDKGSKLEFTPTVDPKWEITITVNGSPLKSENGKYTIVNINKNTSIVITPFRKPADMPIKADIHIWEELTPINGGIIYPKN